MVVARWSGLQGIAVLKIANIKSEREQGNYRLTGSLDANELSVIYTCRSESLKTRYRLTDLSTKSQRLI